MFFIWPQKARAATPTFVACGAASGNTAAITPALPLGISANDILLLFLETDAQAITVANGNGGTWAEVTNSPQNAGTATRLTVFWSRYNGTQGNPTTSDSGDHQIGAICAYRGIVTTGDPWDVTSGDVDTASDTSGSIPGATTTGPDRLVVIVGAGDDDADLPITAVTNSDLANVSAARVNAESGAGNDGGLTVFDGQKASTGAYGVTSLTYTSATQKGMMTIALKPPVTTIGDGTNPSNSSIAPGAPATDLDTFTLQTSDGTDTVTAATVTLASGTSGGLSLVAITSNDGSTTYCSSSNPASDIVSLTSCGIPAAATIASFKIRITPKSHANMPSPPGSTYNVSGTVTSFTSSNSQSGVDTSSATVTIDNASPANVAGASGTVGDSQVSLTWTNPGDSDFHSVVVLRRASSAVTDAPSEGTTYAVSNTVGSSVVACVEASPATNCVDAGLTNGTAYHYRIYAKDNNGNYSATGVVPTGSPFTPAVPDDTTAPTAVINLAATNPGQNSMQLTWTAPGDDGSTGTAATYDIRYSTSVITDGNFASATQVSGEPTPSIAGSSESMTVTGLSAATTYYFALKTSDEVPNTSALSNVPSGTTTSVSDTTAPSAVTNLALSDASSSAITVSWTAPGDDGSSGTAASYDLRYSTSPITSGNFDSATQVSGEPTPSIAGSSESKVVSGLSPNTLYYFALNTNDEVPNTSAISNVPSLATTATPDTTAPAAVTNLSLSNPSSSSMTVSWTAPGDDGSTGTATSYDLRYSTATITETNWTLAIQATGEPAPQATGTLQSVIISGLTENAEYFFAIKTSDEAPNESALSNIVSAATLSSTGGGEGRRIPASTFSGRAFPGAKISIISRDVSYKQVVSQHELAAEDGTFQVTAHNFLLSIYSYGLLIKDKEDRITQTKFFTVDTSSDALVVQDILVPPTIGFVRLAATRGNKIIVVGYASPENSVILEVDAIIKTEAKAEKDGSYKTEIDTGDLDFGSHTMRAKQTDLSSKKESDYSLVRTFIVSRLSQVNTDLTGDSKVDIKDWSVFLSRWSLKDAEQRKIIDFNDDGKVDISDFSIFVKNIRKR